MKVVWSSLQPTVDENSDCLLQFTGTYYRNYLKNFWLLKGYLNGPYKAFNRLSSTSLHLFMSLFILLYCFVAHGLEVSTVASEQEGSMFKS